MYLFDLPHGDISQKSGRKLRGSFRLKTSVFFNEGGKTYSDELGVPDVAFAIYFLIAQVKSVKELLIFLEYILKYFKHFVLNFCRQSKVK